MFDSQTAHHLITSTFHYVGSTYPQVTHRWTGYPQVVLGLSTGCPHSIHRLSTGAGYPHLVHRISTELSTGASYPQVVHTFSTELFTGHTQVLQGTCAENINASSHCSTDSLQEPYDQAFIVVIIRSRSLPVHPLLFEHECIIAWIPYTSLTTLMAVRLLYAS